jgi:gas vesicle protein
MLLSLGTYIYKTSVHRVSTVGIKFLKIKSERITFNNNHTMTTTKVILGILGAAAAGVVIGMLVAPEKGADLRKNIKSTADDWVDELSNWIGKGKEYIDEVKNRAAEEAGSLKSEADESIGSLKEDLARRRA